ncbi:MAG: hypothetical protein JWO30_1307 [Fibrobacteres bacterium]|nr:hypothetical protein [Fibrobacterota bacterium]
MPGVLRALLLIALLLFCARHARAQDTLPAVPAPRIADPNVPDPGGPGNGPRLPENEDGDADRDIGNKLEWIGKVLEGLANLLGGSGQVGVSRR